MTIYTYSGTSTNIDLSFIQTYLNYAHTPDVEIVRGYISSLRLLL